MLLTGRSAAQRRFRPFAEPDRTAGVDPFRPLGSLDTDHGLPDLRRCMTTAEAYPHGRPLEVW
jgi:hypothetical protein